jgi:hypothetical protein
LLVSFPIEKVPCVTYGFVINILNLKFELTGQKLQSSKNEKKKKKQTKNQNQRKIAMEMFSITTFSLERKSRR